MRIFGPTRLLLLLFFKRISWEGILDEGFLRTAFSVCVEFSSSDFRPAE